MGIVIFSSKKTSLSGNSKQLTRTDAVDMDDAHRKMGDLQRNGHELNGFMTDYEEPKPRRRSPSSERAMTENMGPAPRERRRTR
jgi:hypothetical protein